MVCLISFKMIGHRPSTMIAHCERILPPPHLVIAPYPSSDCPRVGHWTDSDCHNSGHCHPSLAPFCDRHFIGHGTDSDCHNIGHCLPSFAPSFSDCHFIGQRIDSDCHSVGHCHPSYHREMPTSFKMFYRRGVSLFKMFYHRELIVPEQQDQPRFNVYDLLRVGDGQVASLHPSSSHFLSSSFKMITEMLIVIERLRFIICLVEINLQEWFIKAAVCCAAEIRRTHPIRPPPEPDSRHLRASNILITFSIPETDLQWGLMIALLQCAVELRQIHPVRPPPEPDSFTLMFRHWLAKCCRAAPLWFVCGRNMWFMFRGKVLLAVLEISDFVNWGAGHSPLIHRVPDSVSWEHFMFSVTATLAAFYWLAGLGYLWFTASVSSLDLRFDVGIHAFWSLQDMYQNIYFKDVPFSPVQHSRYELSVFQYKHRPMMLSFWIPLERGLAARTSFLLYQTEEMCFAATTAVFSFHQVSRGEVCTLWYNDDIGQASAYHTQ